ncbi:hypothetical protein DFH27DRAFT_489127, partial [Peziza echinospora]
MSASGRLHGAGGGAGEDAIGLCPQRVWAVVKSLPGGEYNLAPLLDGVDVPGMIPRQLGHEGCTFDFCEALSVNSTTVKQMHKCGVPEALLDTECLPTDALMFSRDLLNLAQKNGLTTAWRLDGLGLVPKRQPFMAISHVWADGTGGGAWPAGQVNSCLYSFWAAWARELECGGLWWDAICIPSERLARAQAINEMHNNYADAKCTLVHDSYLCSTVWDDSNRGAAALAIIVSPWFTRGWTALELAKSGRVKVLFKSKDGSGIGGYIAKDLDEDILAYPGEATSRYHQLATSAIMRLRAPVETTNDLLISLQLRF